ncbi:MAG TPA: acyl-CoA dehydrogenase family protein [Burkholderiales bacterium]|nr:acyl-CoA dehydrogenase family protein [Burkholderiales bacterium]
MDFELNAEEQALAETVRKFVDEQVEPRMGEIEARNRIPEELLAEAANLGLFGISIPAEYGGSGLNRFSRALVHQMLGRSGFGFAAALASHTGIGSDGLVSIGTEEQKRRYLPRMATGELRAAFALTEPEAGSDATAVKTDARKQGHRYYLNGVKHLISGGARAGLITVIARTNSTEKPKELSVFLVEPSFPGFRVGTVQDTMGTRGQTIAELIFEDCEVPEENRLGPEGEGWIAATRTLLAVRPLIAARCVGACERLIEISTEHARTRKQFGRAIGEFQAIQFMLADMATRTAAARWLTYHAATLADQGRIQPEVVSMAKLYASETLAFVADTALQIQGGGGYVNGNAVGRFYRDARVTRIYEGTSEIQRVIIGKAVLRG